MDLSLLQMDQVKETDMIGTRDKEGPIRKSPRPAGKTIRPPKRDPHDGGGPHYPRGPIFGNGPDPRPV